MTARRKWTAADDAALRALVAEGRWDNTALADIMGRSRVVVRRHIDRLGLVNVTAQPGPKRGARLSIETRAKISEANRRRWRTQGMTPAMLEAVRKAHAVNEATRFRCPAPGTPEGKHYRKVRDTLGVEAARAALEAHG